MKLRRAMAVAAATAVIAPAALLAAPAAYATDETNQSPTTSSSEPTPGETEPTKTDDPAPETTAPEATDDTDNPGETDEPEPGETETDEPEPEPSETDEPEPGETETDEPSPSPARRSRRSPRLRTRAVHMRGHQGRRRLLRPARQDRGGQRLAQVLAGRGEQLRLHPRGPRLLRRGLPDKYGEDMFRSKHVQLQVWDPEDEIWADLNDGGYAVGYIGYSTELEAGYQVNIPMRINVKASAPVGAGFSLGATIYGDSDGECTGYGEVSYKFQIVSAGTDTDGTKPQVGGKAPVTDKKPAADTPKVTGSLAETGAGSALPMIGLLGGAAVAAGAGAVFVVRRRKAGAVA
ncbi:LPXTG cell wall anchor domain-containing protein [Streptomyces sp. INA 01156]